MNLAEFKATMREAMDAEKITPYALRAYLIAKCWLEVRVETHDGWRVGELASRYNNLAGITWAESDRGRYEFVRLPGNAMDKAMGREWVSYRIYPSWAACVRSIFGQLWGSTKREPAVEAFIEAAETTWAANPNHARDVLRFFREFKAEERTAREVKTHAAARIA